MLHCSDPNFLITPIPRKWKLTHLLHVSLAGLYKTMFQSSNGAVLCFYATVTVTITTSQVRERFPRVFCQAFPRAHFPGSSKGPDMTTLFLKISRILLCSPGHGPNLMAGCLLILDSLWTLIMPLLLVLWGRGLEEFFHAKRQSSVSISLPWRLHR